MAFAAGALSSSNVGSTSVSLTSAAATGGTGPYTYQWYRSTTSGFTPGAGNILAGKTALSFVDTGLIPSTKYYYVVVATDTGNADATADSAQLEVDTAEAEQALNQFTQSPFLGMPDLRYNWSTITAQIASAYAGAGIIAGQAMKFSTDATKVPSVTPVTADTDIVAGFVTYNVKDSSYVAQDYIEMSMGGNVMYLMATEAINRGSRLMVDIATAGGIKVATSGKPVCAVALDQGVAGQLMRVQVLAPSFETAP